MEKQLHCIIDSSGSIADQIKYKTCRLTASSLKLAKEELSAVFPAMPVIEILCWREQILPVQNTVVPQGQASLSALRNWLEQLIKGEGESAVLLFSDGLFLDGEQLQDLSTWIKSQNNLHITAVGVGADKDVTTLSLLTSSGQVWSVADLGGAIAEIKGAPLTTEWSIPWESIEESIPENTADDEEEEEDEW